MHGRLHRRHRLDDPGYQHMARFIRQPGDAPPNPAGERVCLFCGERVGEPPHYVICTQCGDETDATFTRIDEQLADKADKEPTSDDAS